MRKNKFGIVVCKADHSPIKNIGDYMQSLAALQFVPKNQATFIERESLNEIDSKEIIHTIMNGWFMIKPENFPPSSSINPLFVSFHVTPKIEKSFFCEKNIDYLKKYEPIGCRDTNSVKLFEKYGVKAFFSGCLTLTLGRNYYKANRTNDKIYIVDPYCDKIFDYSILGALKNTFNLVKTFVLHKSVIFKMTKQIKKSTYLHKKSINRLVYATKLYATYSNIFDDDVLCKALYEEHRVPQNFFHSEEDKFKYTEELLKKYADAKYVVTSRIHCALPCLALETPVIFVSSNSMERNFRPTRPSGRLGGLIDLFKNMYVVNGKIVPDVRDFRLKSKIGLDFSFKNKPDYLKYKELLENKCESFVSKCSADV